MRRCQTCLLQVTLTLPAVNTGRRLYEKEQDEEQERGLGVKGAPHNKRPLTTTDYALLVTVPGGGAANVTYKHTLVHPKLKPAALKAPAVQSNGDLLWARVPMPRYQSKSFSRTFKVPTTKKGSREKGVDPKGRASVVVARGNNTPPKPFNRSHSRSARRPRSHSSLVPRCGRTASSSMTPTPSW